MLFSHICSVMGRLFEPFDYFHNYRLPFFQALGTYGPHLGRLIMERISPDQIFSRPVYEMNGVEVAFIHICAPLSRYFSPIVLGRTL
jgi:hypothetical protein